jgi:hypothetical protein
MTTSRLPRVTRHRTASSGPTYVYRCTVCRKLFEGKTQDTTLRPHKNPAGWQCYGTYGTYVRSNSNLLRSLAYGLSSNRLGLSSTAVAVATLLRPGTHAPQRGAPSSIIRMAGTSALRCKQSLPTGATRGYLINRFYLIVQKAFESPFDHIFTPRMRRSSSIGDESAFG